MSNLKLKIVLTVIMLIFSILPAAVIGFIGTQTMIGYESNVKRSTLEDVSESKSSGISRIFDTYLGSVKGMAALEEVKSAAEGTGSADGVLSAVASADKDIMDVLILDKTGKIVAAVNNNAGSMFENLNAPDGGAVSLYSASPVCSWTGYAEQKVDAVYFSEKIKDDNSNDIGYFVEIVSLAPDSSIVSSLQGQIGNLKNGRLILVDMNGVALNFDDASAVNRDFVNNGVWKNGIDQYFMQGKYANDLEKSDQKSLDGRSGGYTYYIGAVSQNVKTWRWAGIADNGSFGSFSLTTNLLGWAVVAAAAVLFSVLSLVVIGRFLGTMNGMLKTMTDISEAEGATDIRFTVTNAKSELGSIQTSFNELLDEIFLSEERHRTIAQLSDNMLFEWDFHKERMYCSDNMLAKFEINCEQATLSNGRFIDSLMTTEDGEKYKRDINALLKNKNGYSAEYQLTTKSGAVIWVSLRAVCITDRLGEPLRVIGVITDIDNEKKLELQLSERASYDFLSQLCNRNTFIRQLTSEVERRGTKRVAVLFIDVDDFKFINDRYGHTVGDEVIKFVADTIRTKVDDRGGLAGRFGGDEFVLCFTNQEDIDNIENISMDIINELYAGYDTKEEGLHIDVKASIGVAFCPDHTEDVNELLSFADTAMYFVKKNGKTNYHIYLPEDSESGAYIDPEGF